MTWTASVDLQWGGEERRFSLRLAQLQALEDATGCGPLEVWRRLRTGSWRVAEVRAVVRFGLEGAGVSPNEAARLVERYVDQRPLMESVPPAMLILAAALWMPEDLQGKAEADGETTGASPSA